MSSVSVFVVFYFLAGISLAAACPHACACIDDETLAGVLAVCKFPNETSFHTELAMLPSNLTDLYLTGFLGTIKKGMFSSALGSQNNLTVIRFWHTTNITSIEAGAFEGLPNLDSLSVLGTSLTSIPKGLLDGVKTLQELHFNAHKYVTEIGSDVFNPGTCVKTIEIESNAIENIADDAFKNTGSCLATLTLNGNKIKKVTTGTFSGLDKLETLSLSKNEDLVIPSGAFSSLKQLKSLDLDAVFTSETLPSGIFTGLERLQNLSIQDGGLKNFKDVDFKPLAKSLKTVDFSGNKFDTFPAAVSVLTSLTEFRMKNNDKKDVVAIKGGTFKSMKSLLTLDLSGTKIAQPDNTTFMGLTNLQYLTLDRTGIKTLTPRMFAGVGKLLHLSLELNNLTVIPGYAFVNQSSLAYLSMTGNKISKIHDMAFVGLGKLNVLRLDYNWLTNLDVTCLNPVKNAEVFLHDNPWACNCDIDPLRNWVKKDKMFTPDVRCSTPKALRGEPLFDLTRNQLGCPGNQLSAGAAAGIAIAVIVVLIVAGVLIYIFLKRRAAATPPRERIS